MRMLINIFTFVMVLLLFVGCGGSGDGSSRNKSVPSIEDSEFFTSFTLTKYSSSVESGISYYHVSDSSLEEFRKDILGRNFTYEADEDCYRFKDSDIEADACVHKKSGEHYIAMQLEDLKSDTKSNVVDFFPKVKGSPAANLLRMSFSGDKSDDLLQFAESLSGFEPYNNPRFTDCWSKEDSDGFVYSLCLDIDSSEPSIEWMIAAKEIFNLIHKDDIPLIEDSKFFTSFKLAVKNKRVDKGIGYYPVLESSLEEFGKNLTNKDFREYEDWKDGRGHCYSLDSKSSNGVNADACIKEVNSKYFTIIELQVPLLSDKDDDYIINFFPKVDGNLSARFLTMDEFSSGNSGYISNFVDSLEGFTPYEREGYNCRKKEEDRLVYSLCFDLMSSKLGTEWVIATKEFFDVMQIGSK